MNQAERQAFADPVIAAEPDNGVRRAMATLHQFRQRRQDVVQRLKTLKQERAEHAYDGAMSPANSPAGRHSQALRRSIAELDAQLEELDAAIRGAEQRVGAARGKAREGQAVQDARHAIDVAEQLRAKGGECAELLVTFANRYREFAALSEELHRLGFAPTPRLMHLAAERAVSSALQPTRLSPAPGLLPPSLRTSLDVVGEQYASQALVQAKRVVNGEAA